MVSIQREKWKNQFVNVVRGDDGRILSWQKWSKEASIQDAKNKYMSDRTLRKKTSIRPIVKVKEIQQYEGYQSNRGTTRYQYFITVNMRSGERITARSRLHIHTYPIQEARREAENRLFILLDGMFNEPLESDADEGRKIFTSSVVNIEREGTIRYAKI